jgi:uncharacterized membrane protein
MVRHFRNDLVPGMAVSAHNGASEPSALRIANHTLTDTSHSQLDKGAVDLLHGAGLIPNERYFDAVQAARDTSAWNAWARTALLGLGVGQLLAGIVFLFAYNWDDLPPFAKFGIIEAGVLLSVLGALAARPDRPAGQALLIAASVFTGALLAVIGQIYQTGADAYELFTAWALLMTPWVLASRSAGHWLLWFVVIGTAYVLYWKQVLVPLGIVSQIELAVILAGFCTLVLGTRELAADDGVIWTQPHWTRLIALFATLFILFVATLAWLLGETSQILGLAFFVPVSAATLIAYGSDRTDFAALTITGGFVALALMAGGWRVLDETIGFVWTDAPRIITSLTVLVLWCALVTAGAIRGLVALHARQKQRT